MTEGEERRDDGRPRDPAGPTVPAEPEERCDQEGRDEARAPTEGCVEHVPPVELAGGQQGDRGDEEAEPAGKGDRGEGDVRGVGVEYDAGEEGGQGRSTGLGGLAVGRGGHHGGAGGTEE